MITPKKVNESNLKTLEYVVQSVMLDLGEDGTNRYQQYLQWAIRGVKEIGKWTGINVKTKVLPVSNREAALPEDYLRYLKIGICVEIGGVKKIMTLGLNDNLCKGRSVNDCGENFDNVVQSVSTGTTDYGTDYYYNAYGGMYGYTGGFAANYYTIDEEYNRILLASDIDGDEVILEYISTGIGLDGQTFVKEIAIETLIAWIHWKRVEHRKSYPLQEKRERRLMYVSELKNLRKIESRFTAQEYMDIVSRSYKQTVKR